MQEIVKKYKDKKKIIMVMNNKENTVEIMNLESVIHLDPVTLPVSL